MDTLLKSLRGAVVYCAIAVTAAAQTPPKVIAWQAPSGNPNGYPPPNSGCLASYVPGYWTAFTQNILPKISGIGVSVPWACVDNCTPSLNAPCSTPATGGTNWQSNFNWSYLDQDLIDYIRSPYFASKKIVLIIDPESDCCNVNQETPQYVFHTAWSNGIPANPQDVVVCSDWNGSNTPSSPVYGTFASGLYGIWNQNQCSVLVPGGGISCTCGSTSCNNTDFSGFPVVYETPIVTAYQNFLLAFFRHYSSLGDGLGPQIAPYILYARIGISHGGENYPVCSTAGALPKCGSPPCSTASANSTWPGPQGQFSSTVGESWGGQFSYTDAGYLTAWQNPADGTGYFRKMMQFLNASATFPVTVNSTNGPPFGESEIYANVEAQLAAGNNAGFGMQALSINDSIASAYGTESGGNWVANFINYPYAPVHHLQTFQPGSGGTTNASAFTISGISVLGTAVTVSCALDCSLFCGNPSYVYISGSPAGAFDGIHTTNTTCAVDTVDFPLSTYAPNCLTPPSISCGTIWSPNYWPITMPLATQRGATSVEVWECDLDFAFGTSTTSNTCYPSLGSGISSADYLNAISNTLVGIPAGTSFHTDSFYHGWKF